MGEDTVMDILCGEDADDSGEEASTFDLFIGSLRTVGKRRSVQL
jgi:hypothetical protein